MPMTIKQKPYAKQHHAPCHDCPWRRNAIAGWLGPHSPGKWLAIAHSHGPVACHTRCQPNGEMWHCAGAAIYRANVVQSVDRSVSMALPADRVKVFSFPVEFLSHHLKKPVAWKQAAEMVAEGRMELIDEVARG